MSVPAPSSTDYSIAVDGIGPVQVSVTERGKGRPVLLLHGGGGPQTVISFADLLAESEHARVLVPTHPGFGGTQRPDAVRTIRDLAALYSALLQELDLHDVTVVGNSIGGWITAEMGLLGDDRISSIVLVDAVGIEVPGHPVADFFALTMAEVSQLAYHDPERFGIDVSSLPAAAQAVMAGNREALSVYAGAPSMMDTTLRERLSGMSAPTLVLWGESDRIADPDYGRAYVEAIPAARFELLTATGHLPQLETPQQLLIALWAFARLHATSEVDS